MPGELTFSSRLTTMLSAVLVFFGLYLTSLYSYLLFHSLVEMFSIVVACSIFILAWNSRRFLDNNYLLFIGIAYLFVGGLDLLHTLAYKGMGVFPGYNTNLPTQFWIGARYTESLTLFIAPFFLGRKLRTSFVFLGYTMAVALLLGSIFYWKTFPDCFVEGVGLTPFKKISEYIISIILVGSLALLSRKRREFDKGVFHLLAASIVLTIASELAFTFYVNAYGLSNLVGHYCKLISFFFIYKAIIETGLVKPYNLLFRNLKRSEEELRRGRDGLEVQVQERTAELVKANEDLHKVNRALEMLSRCNQEVIHAAEEANLLREICRIVVETGGYRFAWIGIAEADKHKTVRPVSQFGYEDGYLETLHITWADTEQGQGPTGTAIRTAKPSVVRNISTDPCYEPWRAEAARRSYASSIALPLTVNRQTIGALNIYSAEPEAFDRKEVDLLTETAGDLAHGVIVLRMQEERKRAEEALRESEKKYRQLVENLDEGIWVIDKDDCTTFVNPRMAKILGYEVDEMFVKPIFSFMDEEGIEICKRSLERRKRGIEERLDFEFLQKDGTRVYTTLGAAPITDDAGNYAGAIGVVADITESRRLEEQFHQAQKMEAIGRLAGGVAHDFNNLMTVVIGNADLLLTELREDDPGYDGLIEIRSAGQRASALTRQLLAFSRRQVLEPRVLDLNEVIKETEKMLRRVIEESVELKTALAPELGPVEADPTQIVQVIMNLAVNARDAMPHGGKLTLETANIELDEAYARAHGIDLKPGPYVMLVVSDTGIGMDEKTRSQIFEPFFTTKEKGKGTGLGLSTVYGIIKQSGGFIWVYSEPQRGTTFKVYLPRAEAEAVPLPKEKVSAKEVTGSETILIVEDNDSVRKLARQVLQRYGYRVLEARDGEEALRVSTQHEGTIHLTLTDVVMPGMSGRELADNMQSGRPEMKILYMSGYMDNAIVHHGVLDPGTKFIHKPFSPESLVCKVREVLDKD